MKVLFVCLGNICRSPMAEAIFRHLVAKEGLSDKIEVDSAGTSSWHIGKPPHFGTLKKLKEYNIPAEGMFGRQFTKQDFAKYDYIIGMDESNIDDIRQICNSQDDSKIIRLLDLTDKRKDVPDPYFTGDFQETYDLVMEGCQVLLKNIKNRLN